MTRTNWLVTTVAVVALGTVTAARATSAQTGAQAGAQAGAKGGTATAVLEARSGSAVKGEATFTADGGKVTMKLAVSGLTPGSHAIHLHEKGDCSDPQASAAGGHWNPTKAQHGRWGQGAFHHGDIGNLAANDAGEATLTFTSDLWTIGGAPATDIVGRAVIIHEKADDFQTQPTGNAGGRVACGVIRPR